MRDGDGLETRGLRIAGRGAPGRRFHDGDGLVRFGLSPTQAAVHGVAGAEDGRGLFVAEFLRKGTVASPKASMYSA